MLDSNRKETVCAITCCLSWIHIFKQNKRNRFLIENCLKTKNRGRLKAENRFSDDLLLSFKSTHHTDNCSNKACFNDDCVLGFFKSGLKTMKLSSTRSSSVEILA